MEQSFWLTIPSVIALTINSWILVKSDKRSLLKANTFLAIFIIGCLGPNLIEFLTISKLVAPNLLLMKLYYVFMLLALGSVFLLSLSLSGIPRLQCKINLFTKLVYGTAFTISLLILSTNLIISGFRVTPVTVTRVPGDLYIFAQAFFFILLLSSITYLIIGSFKNNNGNTNKRCRILLLSFSPMIVSLLAVVVLMQFQVQINATFIFPVTTIFLMLALIKTECQEDLFKLLLKLPYTNERKSYQIMVSEIESFLTKTSIGQNSSLKNLTSSLEQQIVAMALDISNGSQIQAATLLNTSASSICRKKKPEKI